MSDKSWSEVAVEGMYALTIYRQCKRGKRILYSMDSLHFRLDVFNCKVTEQYAPLTETNLDKFSQVAIL